MSLTSLCPESPKLDELDDAAIVALLQSSDADSSSEHDVTPTPRKSPHYPSTGEVSVWKATVNIVNYIEGVGFLALPYTLRKGGLAAILAFLIVPIILWYTGKIFIDCLYDNEKKTKRTRARSTIKDVGDLLSSKYGGYIVSGCVQIDVFLLSVSYLVLSASLMHHALPTVPITQLQWTCVAGALVLPTTFFKSLSQIAWLSTISVFALVASAVAVIWYGAEHAYEWDLGTILFWDAEGAFLSLSIILYSYASLPILPHVEESMAKKTNFNTALALAHAINVLMKVSFSLFGFLSFGVNTNEAILNNLPPGTLHITVSSVFFLSCILSYVLALYPVIDSFDNLTARIQNNEKPSLLLFTLVRVILVLLTVLLAGIVPHFALIISFLGSSNAPFVLYIFPCIAHLKLKYKELRGYEICIDIILVFLGIIVTIFEIVFWCKTLLQAL